MGHPMGNYVVKLAQSWANFTTLSQSILGDTIK